MKKYFKNILRVLVLSFLASCTSEITDFTEVDRQALISPDYSNIVVPPNIAPLNFKIMEQGSEYVVKAFAHKGKPIVIRSKNPIIQFDLKEWHKLMQEGKGSDINMEIFVRGDDKNWKKFQTLTNHISNDSIDSHLAYRLINTGYVFWSGLGIYQRNLENFDEKPILENKSFEYGCLNCHSFRQNDPDDMIIHIRAVHGGTIVSRDRNLTKIDTKNKYTLNAGVYPSWHPDGKYIAFSVNNINQHFCNGETRIEVSDGLSDLIVYNIETNTISTSVQVSGPSRENLPTWSPDGKYLYFISAPPSSSLDDRIYAKYELLRIGFDGLTGSWGDVDTILSSKSIGKSISFPKVSPNGKYIMFCTSDFGYFTIHHPNTDLNLLDLETGVYREMEVNSDQTDSYHSFSKSGNWFVFSSKRMDGLFTRPYFSYLDENGKASKPFVLPQKDPEFYDSFIQNYNIPELITGEVPLSPLAIRDKVLEDAVPAQLDLSVDTLYMKWHLTQKDK